MYNLDSNWIIVFHVDIVYSTKS